MPELRVLSSASESLKASKLQNAMPRDDFGGVLSDATSDPIRDLGSRLRSFSPRPPGSRLCDSGSTGSPCDSGNMPWEMTI